ncbi:sigma-70 family RNA polymerase sigma factor [Paenibacillus sp. 1P03SA]|uniref:sigma-70 family RNA polymerase sigma factor n=1 Tax=Paenibacillus sp. 1P03SA TaxID=3132294 RepID=UPI0039A399AC
MSEMQANQQKKKYADRFTDLLAYMKGETKELRKERIVEYVEILKRMIRKRCPKAAPEDVQSIVNEAFAEVLVQVRRNKIQDILSFAHFAVSRAVQKYHQEAEKRHSIEIPTDYDVHQLAVTKSAEHSVLKLELDKEIKAAVLSLKTEYREIIIRYYIENESLVDIAAALGIPENQMSQKRKRAIQLIRDKLNIQVPEVNAKSKKRKSI